MMLMLNRTHKQFRIVCFHESGRSRDVVFPYWVGWRFARWRTRRLVRRFSKVKLIYCSPVLSWDVIVLENPTPP